MKRKQATLSSPAFIEDLKLALKDIAAKYPDFMRFMDDYCGYNTPVLSADPAEISYAAGKRDVVLTLKSIMRDDVPAEEIAKFYERKM